MGIPKGLFQNSIRIPKACYGFPKDSPRMPYGLSKAGSSRRIHERFFETCLRITERSLRILHGSAGIPPGFSKDS